MRILLTGKTGQLGWELHRQLEHDYEVIALGREDVDFLDTKTLEAILRNLPALDLIVNAAAYTGIDKTEPFIAETVNSDAVEILATEAERRDIPMIHFSTDHVFNVWRRWASPHREDDHPTPISLYGWTKLEGEILLRKTLEKHLIFRLSGLYGTRRKNFFTEILSRNRNGLVSRVVEDQIISPNWTPLVAEVIAEVIHQLSDGGLPPWGTYHISGDGITCPYEFAKLICQKANELWGGNMPLPVPITSRECRNKRPLYSVLNPQKFNDTFQCSLPNWQEQFLLLFGELTKNRTGR